MYLLRCGTVLFLLKLPKLNAQRFGRHTNRYRPKDRSTSTDASGADFMFAMSKWVSSVCNNIPFIPKLMSLINFRQFKPGILINTTLSIFFLSHCHSPWSFYSFFIFYSSHYESQTLNYGHFRFFCSFFMSLTNPKLTDVYKLNDFSHYQITINLSESTMFREYLGGGNMEL